MRTLEEQVAKARKEVEHKEKAALAEEHETTNAVKFAEQTWGALHQIHIMLQMGHTADTAANPPPTPPLVNHPKEAADCNRALQLNNRSSGRCQGMLVFQPA
jgi:hypothetical protein